MDQVSEIREKIDIVALISEFVPLKQAGRNFKAPCPFHTEKSPSFVVSPERQIWHCFGCNKGGDVYTFIMEYERIEFGEALRLLAKRAGVMLESSKFQREISSQKEQIYKVNALALEFYHYVLQKLPAGKEALSYIKNRGISDKVIETFQLGFAPKIGNGLAKYLMQKKKYTPELLLAAGLTFQKGRDVVDFFRGRLMFPLIDQRDNVVGFSGRVLDSDITTSKYINTRDTLVYHKRDSLFGLNVTKEAIKKENQVVLVEGEFDVMSCFQHGVSNVVGIKGTALTEHQVNLLSRYAQKITMCFDGDRAGQEAIKRSLPLLEKKGVATSVVVIPGGKDPDESLKNSEIEFKKAVKEDTGIYEYLLTTTLSQYADDTPDAKKKIADTLLPLFAGIQNEIIKEHYLKKLSRALDTTYESMQREVSRQAKGDTRRTDIPLTSLKSRLREEVLEEYLLALIVQSSEPKKALDDAMQLVGELVGRERAYQKILYHLTEYFSVHEVFEQKNFAQSLASELMPSYNICLLFPLSVFSDREHEQKEIKKTAVLLRGLYLKEKMHDLAAKIKGSEESQDDEKAAILKTEYSRFATQLKKIE